MPLLTGITILLMQIKILPITSETGKAKSATRYIKSLMNHAVIVLLLKSLKKVKRLLRMLSVSIKTAEKLIISVM